MKLISCKGEPWEEKKRQGLPCRYAQKNGFLKLREAQNFLYSFNIFPLLTLFSHSI